MAMSSVIRKTSHTVYPLALRAIATPRILTGSVTKALSGDEQGIVHRESFVISNQYFSTAVVLDDPKKLVDRKVRRCLKYEIKAVKRRYPTRMPQPPADFPFKIHDTPGANDIRLTRELAGENILIELNLGYDNDGYISTDSSDEEEEEPEEASIDFLEPYVQFIVTISKEKGPKLEFRAYADIHRIEITLMSLDERRIKFSETIGSDLRKHWGKFLAIRGIDEALTRFLFAYMVKRNTRDRLLCLNKLRDFIKMKS